MADITKCNGEVVNGQTKTVCPVRDQCYRYMSVCGLRQSWFAETPGKYIEIDGKQFWECDMFWGVEQDQIFQTLKNIVNGNSDIS